MDKVEDQGDALFEAALLVALRSAEGKAKVFSADELLSLNVVDKKDTLMGICQGLANAHLMRFLHLDGKVHFSLRSKDDASKLLGLSADEIMIYHQIESSGINGIWIKTIKQRTSIVQTVITKSMKVLESKRLVKPVKSIKNPAQKIYMLAYLSPSEGVTGGPWFQDGELDMEMIGVTADAVVIFIEQQSWAKGYIKRERSISPFPQLDEASGAPPAQKRKRGLGDGDIEGVHSKAKRRNAHHTGEETQISYPPGYRNYPTVAAIFHFVKEAGFIKADVPLMESDIQGLLDVLVFDDRIEKIGNGYRTIRGVFGSTEAMKNMMHGRAPGEAIEDADGNGLTQAPCGRCPVFNLCEEGGPVNARNCVYFDAWLRT